MLSSSITRTRKWGEQRKCMYYLSRTLTGLELNYSPIEKTCLALIFSIKKLRHYMQAYMVHLIALAYPIKFVLSKAILLGWLARWGLLLTEYEIIYIPQKVIKGQALADFLADHLILVAWEISDDLPDEDIFYVDVFPSWMMFFECWRNFSTLWWNRCECCICLTTKTYTTIFICS